MSGSSRRLNKELGDLRNSEMNHIKTIDVDESNLLHWTIVLLPDREPYNKGAFKINVDFPAEYPFKPPRITFLTKIYHPNIDEKGQVCLPIITPENWKPATKTEQDHPLRGDLAEEYTKDRKKFFKAAEEFTKKYAEKRD